MAEIKTGIFAKNVQKRLNRAQEKVLQKLGKADETKDEQFEQVVLNFRRQESEGSRLQREMKSYMVAIKGMQQASINLTQSLHEVYEPDWHGKDDVLTIGKDCDALWEDFHNKLVDSTLLNLDGYLLQFPDLKTLVAKRSRKLIDYDSARHHVETLQISGLKNDRKMMKAEDELRKAQRVFDELNASLQNELPSLWDSRVGFYISTFKSVTNLEAKFHREISLVCRQLYEVMTSLAEQHSDKMFTIQGAPSDSGPLRLARTPSPPEDESPPESPDASSNHMLRPVSPGPPRPKSPAQLRKGPPVPPPPKATPTKEVAEEQIIDLFGGEFLPAPSPSQPNERPGESLLDLDFDAFQPDDSVSPIPQTAVPWDMWSADSQTAQPAPDAGFVANWSADFASFPSNEAAASGAQTPTGGAEGGAQADMTTPPQSVEASAAEDEVSGGDEDKAGQTDRRKSTPGLVFTNEFGEHVEGSSDPPAGRWSRSPDGSGSEYETAEEWGGGWASADDELSYDPRSEGRGGAGGGVVPPDAEEVVKEPASGSGDQPASAGGGGPHEAQGGGAFESDPFAETQGRGALDSAETQGGGAFDSAETQGGGALDSDPFAETQGGGALDSDPFAETQGGGALDSDPFAETQGGGALDSDPFAETQGGGALDSAETQGGGAFDSAETQGGGALDSDPFAETQGGGALDSDPFAETQGGGALDSDPFAETQGGGALDSDPFAETQGGGALDSDPFAETQGGGALDSDPFAETQGGGALDSDPFAETQGGGALDSDPFAETQGGGALDSDPFAETQGGGAFDSDPFAETQGGGALDSDPFAETQGGGAFDSDPFAETQGGGAFDSDPFAETQGGGALDSDPFAETQGGGAFDSDPFAETQGGGAFDSDPFAETCCGDRGGGLESDPPTEVSGDDGIMAGGGGWGGDGGIVAGGDGGHGLDADPFASHVPVASSGGSVSVTPSWGGCSDSGGVGSSAPGPAGGGNVPRTHREPESSDMSEDEAANRRLGKLYREIETEQEEVTDAFNGFSQDGAAPSFFADFDKMNEVNTETPEASEAETTEQQDKLPTPPAGEEPAGPPAERQEEEPVGLPEGGQEEEPVGLPEGGQEEEPAGLPEGGQEEEPVGHPVGEVEEPAAPPPDEENKKESSGSPKEEKPPVPEEAPAGPGEAVPSEKMPIPSVVIEPASSNEGDDDRDADIISPTAVSDNDVAAGNQALKHMSPSAGGSELPGDFLFKVETMHDFEAANSDELELKRGDVVLVVPTISVEDQEAGWLTGIKESDWLAHGAAAQRGLFPDNFTQRLK